ncbi:hypothetical protein RvY_05209 [Ramazzottius varieornatus]|uniref:AB hydrolase-1 domain-containing protein n=1 Tax=Ramazzottius varieornatus TaxID=947166 RepID=A0A1D1V388_RAMVA|nr:hypothetical protein RvY_05209 [Ramazzottius varieornatus]
MRFCTASRLLVKGNCLTFRKPRVVFFSCSRTAFVTMHRDRTTRTQSAGAGNRQKPDVTSGIALTSKFQEWLGLGISYVLGTFGATLWLIRLLLTFPRDLTGLFKVKERKLTPAILSRSEWGEHSYIQLLNGMRLHYVISGPTTKPDGEESGLMVMLHGFPDFWFSWRNQIPFFNKDYRVVAVDMRGYGDSAKPIRLSVYHTSHLVEDVQLLIEGLGYKSCILVAHDWGGLVAWAFATLRPQMVDKLVVLNCPHPRAFWHFMKHGPKQWLKSWYIFVLQLPYIPELLLRAKDLSFLSRVFRRPGKELMSEEDLRGSARILSARQLLPKYTSKRPSWHRYSLGTRKMPNTHYVWNCRCGDLTGDCADVHRVCEWSL